ncbi:uncharacterized protein si:ch211-203k16.3 isoform X2 [Syngnathus scovelli]|uniref:uncharacterized protein si:ch211-203k16.3 isoform X2 n=1 Tax=Syngnathus scovelli TaxID=161590 RepID=UPI00210F54B6|nr:uncharacterized protein si:ch211-203k16.3 isoform X4 [Syngnathus scovelli]
MRRAEPPARGSPLWALLLLLSGATAEQLNASGQHGGGSQCGDYTNQPTEDGMCRLVATLPQLDGQRCPDMFRCTDEVSYWLRQNEERKQQVAELKETVRQLHEELRDHRHRIRHFELLQHDDGSHSNAAQERRFHQMEVHYAEATSLLHLQGTLILNLQNQVHNLSRLVEQAKKRPGCLINAVRPNPLMNSQWALHPEIQHMRNCPIDCASIYYNGVTRSGVYTVVPALAALPVEVYCDMDTDGESRVRPRHQMRWRKTMTRRRLDSHPEAGGRLRQLRPRLARIPGRFRRPALRVLAGQRPHPRAERPRGLQLANRSGGLEQQAQARPLSTLQKTRSTVTVCTCRASAAARTTLSAGTTTSAASARPTAATSAPRSPTVDGGTASASTPTSMASTTGEATTPPTVSWAPTGSCGTRGETPTITLYAKSP